MADQQEARVTNWGEILGSVQEAIDTNHVDSMPRLYQDIDGCGVRLSSVMRHLHYDAMTHPDEEEQQRSLGDYQSLADLWIEVSEASHDLKTTYGRLTGLAIQGCDYSGTPVYRQNNSIKF